jgi:hypothetical protein
VPRHRKTRLTAIPIIAGSEMTRGLVISPRMNRTSGGTSTTTARIIVFIVKSKDDRLRIKALVSAYRCRKPFFSFVIAATLHPHAEEIPMRC